MTLHEAMIEVLRGSGWLTFGEVADRIRDQDLYHKGNGDYAANDQVRLRATQSGGRYVHLFEVDGDRIRLRS